MDSFWKYSSFLFRIIGFLRDIYIHAYLRELMFREVAVGSTIVEIFTDYIEICSWLYGLRVGNVRLRGYNMFLIYLK